MSKTQTVDMTPTWEGLLPLFLLAVVNKGAVFMEDEACVELRKMARAADLWNQHCKEMDEQVS